MNDDALNPSELRAWLGFLTASHLMEHEVERQLKADGGMSHGEFEILVKLLMADGRRLRMSDLARQAMISKSRLTYQVTQLERDGFVRRTDCDSDRRAVWAELTHKGEEALAMVRPGHRQVVRDNLISQFSPEEVELFGDLMNRVADRLRDSRDQR
ncbi:MarR family winged helix-turn-helix transcriptional regulator [Actinomadura sp. 6N118]|uniref:MarR family winged helix-turn-helix transcriptional regulator n=1 Tax=Actinomadura sp. 6N118 TaxID=3375151 RepID=UPI00378D02BA